MSAPSKPRWTRQDYERAAQEYRASLPLEHFMESVQQATQREICLTSLRLLKRHRPEVHYFNELLIQYFYEGNLHRVVPDNMVVLGDLVETPWSSYILEEALPPFWVLEYVSHSNPYTDYTEKRERYERELKVPYYLVFDPEAAPLVLTLYRHDGTSYQIVKANAAARFDIPELELEVGLLDGWGRYWYRGSLLQLPDDLERRLEEVTAQLREKDEQIRERDERLYQKDEQIRERDEQLRRQNEQLRQRDEAMAEQQARLAQQQAELAWRQQQDEILAAGLRSLVEGKARLAGRQDVLDALPTTTDLAQLTRWLTELG